MLLIQQKQKLTGLEARANKGGRTAPLLAVFLRLHAIERPLWAGYGGEGLRLTGFFVAGLPTPPYARPPSFGSEGVG